MKDTRLRLVVSLIIAALLVFIFKVSFQSAQPDSLLKHATQPTSEEMRLYKELLHRKIPVKLHKKTRHTTVDIAIPKAKLNIEVDGIQHNIKSKQALSDLKKTRYALEEGYYTLRIPNSLVRKKLHETADLVEEIYEIRMAVLQVYQNKDEQ
jgi:very-short-patch-repair endonuclease